MTSRQDVEKFLLNKYGANIFKYTGFKYIRDIIAGNESYITRSAVQEYAIVAAEYDKPYQSIESAIRYFKEGVDKSNLSNVDFINNLIFEFKNYKELKK